MSPHRLVPLLVTVLCACSGELERQASRDPVPEMEVAELGVPDLDVEDQAPDLSDQAPDLEADEAPDLPVDMGPRLSAGCVSGEGMADGEHMTMLGGDARRYIVRLPQGYTRERAWPLVFALHGNGGDARYWDGTSGARNLRAALRGEAILIVLEAIEGNWRDYNMPAATWPARVERELVYFDAVLAQASGALCVREDAVFAMGFSGGGSFSALLGCRRDAVRAIAIGGAVSYFDEADCVNTPAAWVTIGAEELNSGREALRDYLRADAGCGASSVAAMPAPCVAYEGCAAATPVQYCQHTGGHVWPDFGVAASWAFFKALIPPAP